MSGPAPSVLGLRPVAAQFVTPAAPCRRVPVPHTAAAVVCPVVPEVETVAGACDLAAAATAVVVVVVVVVVSSVTESTLNEIRNQAVTVKM